MRRGLVALVAAAAVLGAAFAAAPTSAQWSDDAWFAAHASAATVELQASGDTPVDFVDADLPAQAVTVPASTFAGLVPGEVRTYTLRLRNNGTAALRVPPPTWTPLGSLFSGTSPVSVTFSPNVSVDLAAGATTTVTMTVTVPSWTDLDALSYRNLAGSGTIRFSATAATWSDDAWFATDADAATWPVQIKNISFGRCVTVESATPTVDVPVQLTPCGAAADQSWTFEGDGTIRNSGLCLGLIGTPAAGTQVSLASCAPQTSSIIWTPEAAVPGPGVTLRSAATTAAAEPLCLDTPQQGPPEAPVWPATVWTCSGNPNQVFALVPQP